jgi:hypothetical protein
MIVVTKAWVIAIWALAVVFPFVTMGVLKISESRWHADIQRAIPWLRWFRRITWIVCLPFSAIGVLGSHPPAHYFAIGMSMFALSAGAGIVENWVKKRKNATANPVAS